MFVVGHRIGCVPDRLPRCVHTATLAGTGRTIRSRQHSAHPTGETPARHGRRLLPGVGDPAAACTLGPTVVSGSVGCAVLVAMTAPRMTEAEARAAVAEMEPIMAIEGRQMSDGDKDLLVDQIRGVITLDEVAAIIAREAGYDLD